MYESIAESDFRKKIKFGVDDKTRHLFFFYGEEDYLKHAAIRTAKAAVVADPFDYVYIGSADYSEEALISAIAAPPMFGAYRLVVLSLYPGDLRKDEVDALLGILGDVDDEGYTVVLLNLPSDGFDPGILPKRPSALYKKLAEIAVPVQFDRVTGAKLNGWVSKHYSGNRLLADAGVCAYTVNYCGADMFRLASEIDKISWYVLSQGRDRVTEADVNAVACSVTEFGAFALTDAVLNGNRRQALEVLNYAITQKMEPVMVMGDILRTLCDMVTVDVLRRNGQTEKEISEATGLKPYPVSKYCRALENTDPVRLKAALEAARTADAGVKGASKGYVPIEQFICSL